MVNLRWPRLNSRRIALFGGAMGLVWAFSITNRFSETAREMVDWWHIPAMGAAILAVSGYCLFRMHQKTLLTGGYNYNGLPNATEDAPSPADRRDRRIAALLGLTVGIISVVATHTESIGLRWAGLALCVLIPACALWSLRMRANQSRPPEGRSL